MQQQPTSVKEPEDRDTDRMLLLLDDFAKAAMTAYDHGCGKSNEEMAREAYAMAQEMVKERAAIRAKLSEPIVIPADQVISGLAASKKK